MTPEQVQAWRWEKELDERNRPLSDDELDALFPLVRTIHTHNTLGGLYLPPIQAQYTYMFTLLVS